MNAVVIVGPYPADTGHLSILAREVSLTVYGSTVDMPWYMHKVEAPRYIRSRDFRPLIRTVRGQSRWVYPGLRSALDEDRPDIVHVVSEPWGLLSVQAAKWARSRGFAGLVLHGCDQQWTQDRTSSPIKRTARARLARYALGIAGGFAGENQGAIVAAQSTGLPEGAPTGAIHTNPRDPTVFRPPADLSERARARERLGLPHQGIGVGFMGRLIPEKGASLFVDTWQSVHDRLSEDAFAAVAGTGSLEELLRDRADHSLRFMGSLKFPEEVADFFRAVDVFVHPPWRTSEWAEQSPRVVLEAMLSGCVIVATDSGAISEVLDSNGSLVPERDQPALESAIGSAVIKAAGNGRDQLARARAVAEFSQTAIAEKLWSLWRQVLGT